MDQKAKAMIQGWIAQHRGDTESVARYIARTLKICGIREARELIAQAQA